MLQQIKKSVMNLLTPNKGDCMKKLMSEIVDLSDEIELSNKPRLQEVINYCCAKLEEEDGVELV